MKAVVFFWCLFLLGFTAAHIYSKYNYMLRRISASYTRVRNGKRFNDGCGPRSEIMALALKHIKDAQGVFVREPRITDKDIARIATVGFLTYHLYPTPVYYLNETAIQKCDYLITKKTFPGIIKMFLRANDEEGNFHTVATNDKYILMKRDVTAFPTAGEFNERVESKSDAAPMKHNEL